MSIKKAEFGISGEKTIYEYTISNGELEAKILNYGGIIRSLIYKGTDVILGRDTVEEYENNEGYFGALIGRNSNRIEKACFVLNSKEYNLYKNDGENNLHGGLCGFDKKIFDVEEIGDNAIKLSAFSPDGEEGFPGNLNFSCTYTVTAENELKLEYYGKCDADTVLNMTNHAYFNLNGHNSGTVDGHLLKMNAKFYTPNTDQCMPYGEIHSVCGTAMDFTEGRTLGEAFESVFKQIEMFGGIDHNFILEGSGMRKFMTLTGDKTGIKMETYTDQPAVQIYTGNVIEQGRVCKEGALYPIHGGVCFETQVFPNAMKFSHFPSPVLKAGDEYKTTTIYKFI